jgi:hypothetical protein
LEPFLADNDAVLGTHPMICSFKSKEPLKKQKRGIHRDGIEPLYVASFLLVERLLREILDILDGTGNK